MLEEADEGEARNLLVPILRQRVRIPLGFRYIQAADLSEWSVSEPSEEFKKFLDDLAGVLGPGSAMTEKQAAPNGSSNAKSRG